MEISTERQLEFLYESYFGIGGDALDRIVKRAYRDVNRTLRKISKLSNKNEIYVRAVEELKCSINDLAVKELPNSAIEIADSFDNWHNEVCSALIKIYQPDFTFHYGQAQKWINMSLKYLWLFGKGNFEKLGPWFRVAHIPIDQVMLSALIKEKLFDGRRFNWSTWKDASAYQKLQSAVRTQAAKNNEIPLALEYKWFRRELHELQKNR